MLWGIIFKVTRILYLSISFSSIAANFFFFFQEDEKEKTDEDLHRTLTIIK